MTTLAAPSVNQARSTLASSFTRGTDTTIVLADGTLFPSPTPLGHVVYLHNADETKFCLVIYTSKAANTLTMGGGATDYAIAKNVSTGDEAYEFPIGTIVDLVCAADEIAHLFTRNGAAIHDDIASEILGIAQDTSPIGTHEFLAENAAGAKKAVPLANFAYGNSPLGQAGNAVWANRTYEGYEIVDTPTTYTIGAAQDFANLKAAADALIGLILAKSITLQLAANVSEGTTVVFTGLISNGGQLIIDLNGHDWTYTGTASHGITIPPALFLSVDDLSGGASGALKWGNTGGYFLIDSSEAGNISLGDIDLDDGGQSTNQGFVSVANGSTLIIGSSVVIVSGDDLSVAAFRIYKAVGHDVVGSTDYAVGQGGILILANGNVITSGGTLTPTP